MGFKKLAYRKSFLTIFFWTNNTFETTYKVLAMLVEFEKTLEQLHVKIQILYQMGKYLLARNFDAKMGILGLSSLKQVPKQWRKEDILFTDRIHF